MGYRSDVYFAISKEARTMALLTDGLPSVLPNALVGSTATALYYEIRDVKWYDSFPEVEEFYTFLSELDDLESPGVEPVYGYIRIGEDDQDVDFRGDPGEYDLWFTRGVEMPCFDE